MSEPLDEITLRVWPDIIRGGYVWQLRSGRQFLEALMPDEELTSAENMSRYRTSFVLRLCKEWRTIFGEAIRAVEPGEGESWKFERIGDYIEGEVLEGALEIEAGWRVDGAERKAITDR